MDKRMDQVNQQTEMEQRMGQQKPTGKKWTLYLLLLYFGSVALYAVLAFVLREGPIVIIDESLYTNIAKSLAWEGSITYRLQPVLYPNILYPLMLVPVYRLQALIGGDIYRWIQVFNVLLISSSIFPVFCFGRDFSGDEKKAFVASAMTVIMGDMLMSCLTMTESLIWPLSLWMMYFAWKMISTGKAKFGVLTGLFTGLMFFTKPGAIAMGAALLLVEGFFAIRKKKALKPILSGIGTLLGVVVMVYVMYVFVFGYDFSLLGLYNKQTSDWVPSHAAAAAIGFVELLTGFCMAGAGVMVLLPYGQLKQYREEQKSMILSATVGLVVTILGTAIFVVPYAWDEDYMNLSVHMRYVSMFMPVWVVFALSAAPKKESKKELKQALRNGRGNKGFALAIGIYTILAAALGIVLSLGTKKTSSTDKLSLAAFTHNSKLDGKTTGLILTALLVLFALWACVKVSKKIRSEEKFRRVVVGFAALTMAFNTCCASCCLRIEVDEGQVEDALELNELIKDEENIVGMTQEYYDDIYAYWQEAHMSKPMQQVTNDQMFVCMMDTAGVYEPFTPINQAPNVNNGLTPEADVIVLGQTIAEHLELSDAVTSITTANGFYTVVYLQEGQRWVDSMMYGMDDNILTAGKDATICSFKTERSNPRVYLEVYAPTAGTMLTVTQNGESVQQELEGRQTLEIYLSSTWLDLTVDQDVYVYSYVIIED